MKLNIIDDQRGQVLVETCIGLALMAFVWMSTGLATFMSNNHVKTAVAARHAAWMKGNKAGDGAIKSCVQTNFMFLGGDEGLVQVDIQAGKGSIAGLLTGDDKGFGQKGQMHWVEVTYGTNSRDKFPFSILDIQFPFMPKMEMDGILFVKSHCQWSDVHETWTNAGAALKAMWDMLKAEIGSMWGKVSSLFS